MATTEPRYVVRYGDAGPRIVDRIEHRFAPFTDGGIAADTAALLLAARRSVPVIWITPSQMDDIDELARTTRAHGNG
jgi:hypothetical protein